MTNEDQQKAREIVGKWGVQLPRSPSGTVIWETRLGLQGVETLANAIATAITEARAETWKAAIDMVHQSLNGDDAIAQMQVQFEAAAGDEKKPTRAEALSDERRERLRRKHEQ